MGFSQLFGCHSNPVCTSGGNMWFTALASDYDGTLAAQGKVSPSTVASLEKFRQSGRKLILVTGRCLKDLKEVFPELPLFDLVVVENGAVLYDPATKEETAIAPEPPDSFINALQLAKVTPLEIGKVIVATWEPNEQIILDIIRKLGLEHQVIFNKGAVMVLPPGINKATGLDAALLKLGISRHNVVGVGDAQNDLAFLTSCECGVAVANSLPSVIEAADIITEGARGEGVAQLVEKVLGNDLTDIHIARHNILIGTALGADGQEGEAVYLDPRGSGLLIAGTSGCGKSTAVTAIVENLSEQEYQFALIDPEGDFESLGGAAPIGNTQHAPTVDEVVTQLSEPKSSVIVNLLGVPLADRPTFLGSFMPRISAMRAGFGRPHWIVVDEAHHMLPKSDNHIMRAAGMEMTGVILITVHPEELAPESLQSIDQCLILGKTPKDMLEKFATAIGSPTTFELGAPLESGEAFYWRKGGHLVRIKTATPHTERLRHLKKYAEGDVGLEKSFYFKGPNGKLNLRAQNLILFVQIAEGVDDETWLYHLRKAEYSRWFGEAIKDDELSKETAAVEEDQALGAAESKEKIFELVRQKYTASATGPQLNSENALPKG